MFIRKKVNPWLIALPAWLLSLSVLFAKPFSGLGTDGHWVLTSVLMVLALWIVMPGGIPRSIAGLFMCGFLLLSQKFPYSAIFGGFIDPTIWTLIPALAFGYALKKTGLGYRIALYIINVFPPTIIGLTASWVVIGIVLSALTPSIIVRISIVMPLVVSFFEILKIPDRSSEAAYISMLAFIGAVIPGNGWLTGSLSGPINMGFLPQEMRAGIDWASYTVSQIVPWLLITVILLIYIFLFFRPVSFQGSQEQIRKKYLDLGPISRPELVTLTVLSGCFAGFVTIPLHHLKIPAICLLGLFLLYIFSVLDKEDIVAGINWDLIFFFGTSLSIAPLFKISGVGEWFSRLAAPVFGLLAENAWVFVIVLTLVTLCVRLVDVAFGMPTAALLLALTPVYSQFGVHPLVICTISSVEQSFFLFTYQSPFAIIANSFTQNRSWSDKQLSLAGVGYILAVIISLTVSVYYWRRLGLI
ncbi:MAG: anion permease [Peptococcaceae bacterium]|nr:anion permease [Peptococcaceae bacterium]